MHYAPSGYIFRPIFQYGHGPTPAETTGEAIIGGYVVRDPALTGLTGRYLYGDVGREDLRTLDLNAPGADPRPAGLSLPAAAGALLGFGEDGRGCVYAMTETTAYRVAESSTAGKACPVPKPAGPNATPADSTPPGLSLKAARHQRLRHFLQVFATCDEACSLQATGSLSFSGAKASALPKPIVAARPGKPGVSERLRLKLPRAVFARAKRALSRGSKVTARVKITATDPSGNGSQKEVRIKLSAPRPREVREATVCDSVPVTLPPEPSMGPLRQTLRWGFRPLPFMQECREKYGEAFSVKFLGFERPMVLISDPVAVKALYTERENGLPPGRNIVLEPIMGSRSILLLEGSDHLARRKLMLPAFHGERMRSYEPVVEEIVSAEIDSWPIGQEFPIHSRMQAVTLEVILQVVFGVSDGARLDRLRGLLGTVLMETASPATQLIGLATRRFGSRGPWAKFEGMLNRVDEQLYAEIAERRADPGLEERDDILSALILARFEDGEGMSDAELRDQLMTLLLAGHETTATALAWTFDLLLRNAAPMQRLRDSLEDESEDYLRATISESLRLRPVIPLAGRRLAKELSVDGLTLPAGTDVTPAIWLTHTRADIYPEPFAFRPERFLEEAPDTYAWIPFGGGIRRCLGASFAEFEMRIMLREVLTRCDLHKASPAPERIGRRNITLSPRGGTPVIVTARRPARERDLAAA